MKFFQTVNLASLLLATSQTQASPISNIPAKQQQTQPKSQNTQYSNNWSGIVQNQSPSQDDVYTHVSAAITIPDVSLNGLESYQAASIWVGIDGASDSKAILQTGVEVGILDGSPRYTAWHQWFPEASKQLADFELHAGDVVVATVESTSSSSGTCVLENKSTGQTVTKTVKAPNPTATITGQNTEWIVEDFLSGDAPVPLVDFSEVKFEGCQASGKKGGKVGVADSTPFHMVDGKKTVTTVDVVDDSRFVVKHL